MKPEEHNDPVWDLLKQARKDKAGPSFVKDLMLKIETEEQESSDSDSTKVITGFFSFRALQAAAAIVAVAAVISLFVFSQSDPEKGSSLADLKVGSDEAASVVESGDVLTIIDGEIGHEMGELEYVDDLLAVQDPVLLSDADIAMLLF